MLRRLTGLALAVLLGAAVAVVPTGTVAAAPVGCDKPADPGQEDPTKVPWYLTWLDPQRTWPLATGAGQTVAVIDTGVDGTHPQLAGRVLAGHNELGGGADDNVDCSSYGTGAASLVAARQVARVGLYGLAPDARVLPVRVGNGNPVDTSVQTDDAATPQSVAAGIRWATTHGATVIDVSPVFHNDDTALRTAVAAAVRAGIVVVASAGDDHRDDGAPDPLSFPAYYPGVLGVGAVDDNGARSNDSQVGSYVDLVAPGETILVTSRAGGYQYASGTNMAAAVVAATVALVRQAWPGLTADQLAHRVTATADPAPGGQHGGAYGHGIVDPYRAVTEKSVDGTPGAVAGVPAPTTDPARVERNAWWHWSGGLALVIGAAAGLCVVAFTVLVLVLRRGRRRGWRPGRAPGAVTPPASPPDIEDRLFDAPTPADRMRR